MNAADNPFNFPGWQNDDSTSGSGATQPGVQLSVGVANTAFYNFATILQSGNPQNTVFSAWNVPTLAVPNSDFGHPPAVDEGCVAVYGRTSGATFSAGVCGQADVGGCGVCGLSCGTVGEASIFAINGGFLYRDGPGPPDPSPPPPGAVQLGIGVAGRALGAEAIGEGVEDSIETLFPFSIGVLGHSSKGVGVRGHGGFPLATTPLSQLNIEANCALRRGPGPGAVLSAGRLTILETDDASWDKTIASGGPPQTMSGDFLAQLRLVPALLMESYEEVVRSQHLHALPALGNLGDIFVVAGPRPNVDNKNVALECNMFLCVQPGLGTKASSTKWKRFRFGDPITVSNAQSTIC
jgi:hypothetical protein